MSFTVAITGRPNVGKSTFFNRLLEQRKAIVDDMSGVTRDRQYGVAEWIGKSFNLIDTGGFVAKSDDIFEKEIAKQVHIAIEEANVIIFMVDASTGITNLDEGMSDMLRKSDKPVMLVVNKVDNHTRLMEASEFYSLGFENIFFLSKHISLRWLPNGQSYVAYSMLIFFYCKTKHSAECKWCARG